MRESGIKWLDVEYVRPLIESLCQLKQSEFTSGVNESGINWLKMRSKIPVGNKGVCCRVAVDYWKGECLILSTAGLITVEEGVQSVGVSLSKFIDKLFNSNHGMYIRLEDEPVNRYFDECNDMLRPAAIDIYGWGDIDKCLEQVKERKGGKVNFLVL